jgi:hypothetical protein
MKLKILFYSDTAETAAEFGPYDWVAATERELRVPVNSDAMDEEAKAFRELSLSVLAKFDNLLAVRQEDGSWELREMAGKEAYEVYNQCQIVEA